MQKIRTAVIGAGKMGGIHARVYDSLKQCELTAVVDKDEKKGKKVAKKHKCDFYTEPADIIGKVDAATISTPTEFHYETAKLCLENKIPVLIEKPLAATLQQGQEIVNLAHQNGVIAAVGHSERCNPVVQAMKRLEIEPKFIEANRISPYPFRSTDIGVVMDVMIHDIDIILSLARSPIKKVDAVGVNVIDENEDICNARIFFENGCIANMTASRLALKTERKVRVFSRQAYLSVDYFKKTGTVIKAAPNVNIVEKIRELKNAGKFELLTAKWQDMLHRENLKIDDKEPLTVEQESFLNAVAGAGDNPEVTAEEGLAAMQCADKILKCVSEHKWE
jgi:predicted dehydrogenase